LIIKAGRKLPESIKKPLRKFRSSNKRKVFNHFVLRGHIIRIIKVRKYLRNHFEPKLQVGCGHVFLTGWLNADIASGEIYLNAEKKIPFKDDVFDFVYCEHLLEHLSLTKGSKFLKECHRILRTGGIIRIATPDLEKLIDLYFDQNRFVKRQELIEVLYGKEASLSSCEMFNNYMHLWGHKFIYDKNFITLTLTKIGFKNVILCENKKSKHKELANLERHNDKYEWLNPAEAVITEARK
jgi:predicted SAM-dependent methyltransferase